MFTSTTLRATFTRHHLLLARLSWAAICLLILSMIAASLPHLYVDIGNEWQVNEARAAAMRLFSTRDAYHTTIISLRLITLAIFILTALFLAWRKWDDWFVLYISATLLMFGYFFGMNFNIDIIRYPRWLAQNFPAIRGLAPSLIAINMVLVFYLFPNGRFTPRWLIWFIIPAILFILTFMGEAFYYGTPWTPLLENGVGWLLQALNLGPDRWFYLFAATLLGTVLIGLINQLVRFQHMPPGIARQQIKWVILGLATLPLTPLLQTFFFYLSPIDDSSQQFISLILSIILPLAIPLTIAFSMLRYRLWEVDVWINRTVVYGGLTAVILTLYGLSVGLLSSLIPNNSSQLIPFIALTVAALTAIPAHRPLQRLANQWLPLSSKQSDTPSPPRSPVPPLPFRLAHLTWIALCAFLIWQFVLVLGNFQSILAFQHNEWSVQESLKALPGVTAASYALYLMALRLATAGFYWLTAVLIFWRKRDDWFALTVSFLLLLLPFSMVLGDISSDPLEALGTLTLFAALLLPFFFPDGRLIPQSTRWRICLIVYLLLVPLLIFTLLPLIFPHFQPDDVAWVGLILSLTAILAAGMVSQIVRYRRMAESERQQTKWVLMGGFGSLSVMFLWMSVWVMGELSDPLTVIITMHISIFASVAFPLTIGYSILRYRLWEVDVWINRTLVFGGLTVLVTAVYILTVGLMSNLFQSGSSLALSVLATGLIAILFNPVRQRLQTAVNRLMYGERDDPITVLTALGRRLAETAVPIQTLPALVETIAQTLRLPYVAIVAAEEQGSVASLTGAGEIITAYPSPLASPPSTFAFPLVYQSETIGQLLVAPRAPGEVFNPAERRLLENVARQAGTAVYAAQLTHDLQRSRERLVTTREEERRRIRRDLHDGLGPQLATLTLKVDAARNYLRQKPETTRPHSIEATDHLLVELKREIQEAIQAVRRLAYNLRPPALDQLGLSPALSEYATQNSMNGLLVTVDVPMALPPLSAAVEVAAYRIAQEAITNVVRHARATHCRVKLSVVNDVLCLEINDDGVGLPVHIPPGVGLASMRERTAELGGTFNLQSTPGTGAQVSIRLPLTRS